MKLGIQFRLQKMGQNLPHFFIKSDNQPQT